MFKADVNVHTRLALRERVLDQPHLVELEDEDNTKLEEGAQGRSEMAGAEDTTMTSPLPRDESVESYMNAPMNDHRWTDRDRDRDRDHSDPSACAAPCD